MMGARQGVNPDAPEIPDAAFCRPLALIDEYGLLRRRIEARYGLLEISLLRRVASDQSTLAIRLANETT